MARKKKNTRYRLIQWVCIALVGVFILGAVDFAVDVYWWEGASYPGIPGSPASHMEAGRWGEALDEMLCLLDQGREYPNMRYDIAQCYQHMGIEAFKGQRYDEAFADFEDGLWYDEDSIDLQLCLAATCLTMSRYDRAERLYRKVIASDPNNVQALKALGEIHYLGNDIENAEIFWRQALAFDPDDAILEQKLSKLRKESSVVASFDVDEDLHFTIVHDGELTSLLEYDVLEILDEAYYDIARRLKIYPKRQVAVALLAREEFFDITASPDWSSGWYEGQIKIPVANAETGALREILVHEYVHAVLFDHVGKNCPWWFNEGLAQYISKNGDGIINGPEDDPENALSLNTLTRLRHSDVFRMNRAEASRAYATALAAFGFLVDRYGEIKLQEIIGSLSEGTSFDGAFESVTGHAFEKFEDEWRRSR